MMCSADFRPSIHPNNYERSTQNRSSEESCVSKTLVVIKVGPVAVPTLRRPHRCRLCRGAWMTFLVPKSTSRAIAEDCRLVSAGLG